MEFAPMHSQQFGQYAAPISAFDMRHMSNSLPDYAQHRYGPSQQIPQISQASAIDSNIAYASVPNQHFASQIANQFVQQYSQQINAHQRPYSSYNTVSSNTQTDLQHHGQYYSPPQHLSYGINMPQQPQYPQHSGHPPGSYAHMPATSYQGAPYQVPHLQVGGQSLTGGPSRISHAPQLLRRNSSNSSLPASSTLRGPPRKPKQSGHALWVGNLPPGTQIVDLKDHFSRDATDDIESVFLISKSNCAFVNYKTEESCAAAMTRFHDSRFRGVRLVCRLRRGSNPSISPVPASTGSTDTREDKIAFLEGDGSTADMEPSHSLTSPSQATSTIPLEKIAKEKFFIVKSLTIEDLERSVNSGIWATQSHNEENLNLAFQTAENVYLIFSANKSGEYFGYARMDSTISADASPLKQEDIPRIPVATTSAADLPLTIPTPATATAPRGHIIDDSARGTIFWEAENDSLTPGTAGDGLSADSGETSGDEMASKEPSTQQTTFGKPFKITWQSTERLPFYRTRGLRNPWNANREVKIARDGTELEPSVGRRLLGLFEQQAQINAAARAAGPPAQFGYPQQMHQYPGMMPQGSYGFAPQGMNPPYGRPY